MTQSLPSGDPASRSNELDRIRDVFVELSVELGRRQLIVEEILDLKPGSTIEFHKPIDESLDIRVNGRLVARGEAIVMGERYGVRVIEVVSPEERLRSGHVVKENQP